MLNKHATPYNLNYGTSVLSMYAVSSVMSNSATACRVAHEVPLYCVGFSWQEYWSGLPCSPPGDLPDPGIGLCLCIAGEFFTVAPSAKPSDKL